MLKEIATVSYHNCAVNQYESISFLSGDVVTVLPTCTVPLTFLDRRNWQTITPMGNFRSVYSVDYLTSGEKPKIIVKSPEGVPRILRQYSEKIIN